MTSSREMLTLPIFGTSVLQPSHDRTWAEGLHSKFLSRSRNNVCLSVLRGILQIPAWLGLMSVVPAKRASAWLPVPNHVMFMYLYLQSRYWDNHTARYQKFVILRSTEYRTEYSVLITELEAQTAYRIFNWINHAIWKQSYRLMASCCAPLCQECSANSGIAQACAGSFCRVAGVAGSRKERKGENQISQTVSDLISPTLTHSYHDDSG